MILTLEMLARIEQLCLHPSCESQPEQLIATIAEHGVDPETYLDVFEMQLDVLAACSKLYDKFEQNGRTQEAILYGIGASLGVVLGRVTHKWPVEGQNVASYLGENITERFNHALMGWFAWRDTAPPKTPTHAAAPALN